MATILHGTGLESIGCFASDLQKLVFFSQVLGDYPSALAQVPKPNGGPYRHFLQEAYSENNHKHTPNTRKTLWNTSPSDGESWYKMDPCFTEQLLNSEFILHQEVQYFKNRNEGLILENANEGKVAYFGIYVKLLSR